MLLEQPASPGHTRLQPPQLSRSVLVSTHPALQHMPDSRCVPASKWHAPPTVDGVQVSTPQMPLAQVSLTAHSRPQLPQLTESVLVSVHDCEQQRGVPPSPAHGWFSVELVQVSATQLAPVQVRPAPHRLPQ